jgi:hypothetical protein
MRRLWLGLATALGLLGGASASSASAEERAVQAGGVNAVLIQPKAPRASVILLAGGDGMLGIDGQGRITRLQENQLVRTRGAYAARGFAVLVPDGGYDLSALVTYMAQIKRPVAVVATSRGTFRAAQGIASGARPDRLILTSGELSPESGGGENAESALGSPDALPPTLIVHHRDDGCHVTSPAGVAPFIAWAKGKAKVVWLSGGADEGDPCQAMAHHGFNGLDGRVVSVVSSFVR